MGFKSLQDSNQEIIEAKSNEALEQHNDYIKTLTKCILKTQKRVYQGMSLKATRFNIGVVGMGKIPIPVPIPQRVRATPYDSPQKYLKNFKSLKKDATYCINVLNSMPTPVAKVIPRKEYNKVFSKLVAAKDGDALNLSLYANFLQDIDKIHQSNPYLENTKLLGWRPKGSLGSLGGLKALLSRAERDILVNHILEVSSLIEEGEYDKIKPLKFKPEKKVMLSSKNAKDRIESFKKIKEVGEKLKGVKKGWDKLSPEAKLNTGLGGAATGVGAVSTLKPKSNKPTPEQEFQQKILKKIELQPVTINEKITKKKKKARSKALSAVEELEADPIHNPQLATLDFTLSKKASKNATKMFFDAP